MSDFKKAIKTVIREHEGGFQNSTSDPGNYTPDGKLKGTKFGISAKSFPGEDIANLTLDRAVEIYQKHWGGFGAIEDQRVLTKVLDLAVNMQFGLVGPATKILQRAVIAINTNNWSAVDGYFGSITAEAANACDPQKLLNYLCIEASTYYEEIEKDKPQMAKWAKGWNRRAVWIPEVEEG